VLNIYFKRFFSFTTGKCIECPNNWILNGTYCYFLSDSSKSWNNALGWCKQNNGTLVNFHTEQDFNFFRDIDRNSELEVT
jgi:hypothetical protein